MGDPIHDLTPRSLWGISPDSRRSPPFGQEEAAADFVIAAAKQAGATIVRDKRGNVVARVPATKGRESAPTLILQSHLDMVCEKNRDVSTISTVTRSAPHRR
jgi:dipeptidase D